MALKWDNHVVQVATGCSNQYIENSSNAGPMMVQALQGGITVKLFISPDEGFQDHVLQVDARLKRLSAFLKKAPQQGRLSQLGNELGLNQEKPLAAAHPTASFPVHQIVSILSGSAAIKYSQQHGAESPELSNRTALVLLPKAAFSLQASATSAIHIATQQRAVSRGSTASASGRPVLQHMILLVPGARLRVQRCLEEVIAVAPGSQSSHEEAALIIQMYRRKLMRFRAVQLHRIEIATTKSVLEGSTRLRLQLAFMPAMKSEIEVRASSLRDCSREAARVQQDLSLVPCDAAQLGSVLRDLVTLQDWLETLKPEAFQADGLARLLTDTETLKCVMLQDRVLQDCSDRIRREAETVLQNRETDDFIDMSSVRAAVIALESMIFLEEEYSDLVGRAQAAGKMERLPIVDTAGKIRDLGPLLLLGASDPLPEKRSNQLTLTQEPTSPLPSSLQSGRLAAAGEDYRRVSIDPSTRDPAPRPAWGPRIPRYVPPPVIVSPGTSADVHDMKLTASSPKTTKLPMPPKLGREEGVPCIGPSCKVQ